MARAGSKCLSIFTHPLNVRVLRAFKNGPLRPAELEKSLGWAPQSSLRVAAGDLRDLGALARVERSAESPDPFPRAPLELTSAGNALIGVADALEEWLQRGPEEAVTLTDDIAHGTVRVLNTAWDSGVIRVLAECPVTLAELSADIADVNYPALKRRLGKLRTTQLVAPADSGRAAYQASTWLRLAVTPLAAAIRWEHSYLPHSTPLTQEDVEAACFLTLPLAQLSEKASGACTLFVIASEGGDGKQESLGVTLEVVRGKIVSCEGGAPRKPSTWALGSIDAWLDAVLEDKSSKLRVSGAAPRLAVSVVQAFSEVVRR